MMYWGRLHRGPLSCFAVSGPQGLVQGCYAPETLWPLLDPPLRDGLRGGFLDLENGAIWPLNGLRAKNSTFSGSRGWILIHGAVERTPEMKNPSWQTGSFQVSQS